ncbi:hypothetical protein [Lentilactobacillus parafarraginis]|nr:hypothetical protein [Lentilactobacillus parafarraginis]
MAHNVSHDEELLGILRDVATHRFNQGRQINPNSMLYRTVRDANESGYLEKAVVDEPCNQQLTLVNLSSATLTKSGEAKLAALTSQATKS